MKPVFFELLIEVKVMAEKFSSRLFPLEAGQVITISGKTNFSANRFDIDFTNAPHPGDIPFHLSVRFHGSPVIIRNAYTRGVGWGHEESHLNLIPSNTANPIRKGFDFKIAIYVDTSMFFVSIGDKPFCYFPHRQPLHVIQRLIIKQDVDTIYQVDHTTVQPTRWPTVDETYFSALAPKNFKAGSVIVFSAIPQGNMGNFRINLTETGNDRVLFHLRPYLNNGSIVINDQDDNKNWRSDMTLKPIPYPFVMGQKFIIRLGITNHSFMIAVNGRTIATFPHRDGCHKIFGTATGIDVKMINGLRLAVQSVDHFTMDSNCCNFENYGY